ncbi:unnamed protein product [Pedinophyceae sp. YPF-701]|nr:unnamed protein product [Pedinophyceae sp. YPF-701]
MAAGGPSGPTGPGMADMMPMLAVPHDSLRQGLPSYKQDAQAFHPLQRALAAQQAAEPRQKFDQMRNIYGLALPARLEMEKQILSRPTRLPGLADAGSKLGLDSATGRLDTIDISDVLNRKEDDPCPQPDGHSVMEARLGIATKPAARGIA